MDRSPSTADVFLLHASSGEGTFRSFDAEGHSRSDPISSLLWTAPGSLDADLVAAAWLRSGVHGLATVAGPWGVVLRDPVRREHVVACDPVGVQPLFWARTADGGIVISSWIAAISGRDDVDDALDYDGVVISEASNCHGATTWESTRYRAIRKIPWGRALRIGDDGTIRLQQYWFPEHLPGPDESLSLSDCGELLRERIDAAVRRLTPLDVPVGAHVSGGLDCSAVACRAHEHLRSAGRGGLVAGYSWAPSEQHVPRFPGDERDILDDIAAAQGFPIRLVHPDESGDWWHSLDGNDYPQSTHMRERFTLPQASADGVRVLLSGWGGDELASFNGRLVIAWLVRGGHLGAAGRESIARAELLHGPAGLDRKAGVFLRAVLSAKPPSWRLPRRRGGRRAASDTEARIDRTIRAFSPLAADIRKEYARGYRAQRTPRDLQLFLLTDGHLQHRTAAWYQTGRLWGIDYRYPLLDLGVVQAALRMPWWAWRSDGWTRAAYRAAVAPWVPPSVVRSAVKAEPALMNPPLRLPVQRSAPRPSAAPTSDPRLLAAAKAIEASYLQWPAGSAVAAAATQR